MSMKTKLLAGLVAFGTAATTFAQERFNVYGFMDATYSQTFGIKENNPLQGESFLEPFPNFATGNVNLYFDFAPTEDTRSLIEINLNSTSENRPQTIGNRGGVEWANLTSEQESQITVYAPDEEGNLQPVLNPLNNQPMNLAQLRGFEGLSPEVPAGSADEYLNAFRSQLAAGLDQGEKDYENSQLEHAIELERAWFELSFSDQINLRVGRFITPAGIWNVDHGSPIITTVSQPNQTSFFPIFPERQQGVMLLGTMFVGDHDLNYQAYLSTGRFQDGVGGVVENDQDLDFEDYAVGGHVGLRLDMLDGINIGASGLKGSVRSEAKYTTVGTISGADQVAILNGTLVPDGTFTTNYKFRPEVYYREMVGGLDLKIEHQGITLQGEVNYRYMENLIRNDFQSGGGYTDYLGYYGLVSYMIPITPKYSVTPYSLFEEISWNHPQNTNPSLADFPISGWRTYMAGLNFGLGSNYRIKTEFTYGQLLVQDPSKLPKAIVPNGRELAPLAYEQGDLDVMTFSTQFSMAF